MTHVKCVDVAIVGGGLGGLACAAGLARKGYDVHIFEAAQALRTSTSTLISLGGNAFNALEALHPDIVPQLKHVGCLRRCISTYKPQRDGPTGEPQRTQGNMAGGAPYGLRWSEVQRILSGFVPAECVHCGYYATGYTEHEGEDRVSVHFKGKPDVRARLVVAADGVRSALRKTMIPQDPGPRYLGHMNWNALLYNPDNSVVQAHGPGEVTAWTDGPDSQTFKHFMFVNDAGGGYTFWQLRVQYNTPSFTTPPADSTAAAAAGSQQEEKPYLVGGGLGKPGSKARVISLLQEAGFTENIKVVEATPESDIFERALLDRLPLDEVYGHMSSPGKRVVLLGDAAHAMHSGPGQGGRTAFEDAHTLMAALEKRRPQLQGWQLSAASAPATQASSSEVAGKQQLPAMSRLSLNQEPAGVVADEEAVHAAVAEYEQLRLARTCRIQRRAAEGAGLDSIRCKLRPQGISPEEYQQRDLELHSWLAQYPDPPTGDPGSTWWKPPADMAAAGAPAGAAGGTASA